MTDPTEPSTSSDPPHDAAMDALERGKCCCYIGYRCYDSCPCSNCCNGARLPCRCGHCSNERLKR